MAFTCEEIFLSFNTMDASIRSSNLAFVHEPIKTLSMDRSVIGKPGVRFIYFSARIADFFSSSFPLAYSSGFGIVEVTSIVMAGLVPHVTWGTRPSTFKVKDLSYFALASGLRSFQLSSNLSNDSFLGVYFFSRKYSKVTSSGDTRPALAPASIDILHIVILFSMERFEIKLPRYSITDPDPPDVPMFLMIDNITSFADTARSFFELPFRIISKFLAFFIHKH